MEKVYLVLQQGSVFEGYAFGAKTEAVGEIVFNTGVCGYLETLTDANYYGQIVVQTFPLIGNYGVIEEDLCGESCLNGYVVREWCSSPSNFRSEYDVDKYLKDHGIPGIYGVDTREITRIIRENGVMNAGIYKKIPEDIQALEEFRIIGAVEKTGAKEKTVYEPKCEAKAHAALIDYGTKRNLINEMLDRGCKVTVLPYDAGADEVLAEDPDGIILSDGPGDPKEAADQIEVIKKLLGKKPIFGLGLGHQLLALAGGADTFKLKHGHRGSNYPVRELQGTKTYITSQNHGYAVDPYSLSENAFMTYENANDSSCEGIAFPKEKAFSVQFIPEGFGSSFDTSFIYDQFISDMGGEN